MVEFLSSMQEALGCGQYRVPDLGPALSTMEARHWHVEAGGPEIQGQLGHVKSCLKTKGDHQDSQQVKALLTAAKGGNHVLVITLHFLSFSLIISPKLK